MCGIVAVLGRNGQPVPPEMIERATASLVHRGPDDSGRYHHDNVALGFRRLAIIDLSAGGHQPMSTPDDRFTVVFNGEIYNYVELRKELEGLGHSFRTSSDTEVLLLAYREWGEKCVERFNGMWAFVIYDRHLKRLFGSRDRLGVKPLYVWKSSEWIVLASEHRAIAAMGAPTPPDLSYLADFITWGRLDHGNRSCISGIRSIPAGHRFAIRRDGHLAMDAFWTLPSGEADSSSRGEAQWIEELASLVTSAVALRMRSDVPIGFTMSGGIDSTLLICEAARLLGDDARVTAFSYQDIRYDEKQQIGDTVSQSGARLFSLTNEDVDPARLLPEVVRAHDQPIHSPAAIANYELFRLARLHGVKVVIGGQGADEVLCGYPIFQQHYWYTLAADRKWRALLDEARRFSALHNQPALATFLRTLFQSAQAGLSRFDGYRWLASRFGRPRRPSIATTIFSSEFLSLASPSPWREHGFRLGAVQQRFIDDWPLPLYLRIEDRNSMAHSVEARLPFTDYRIVEHALRMPNELRYSGGINKVALRKVAQGRVPRSVTSRTDKFGFSITTSPEAARNLQGLCRALCETREFRERGIYSLRNVRDFLSSFRAEDPAHAMAAFQLAQTELWLQSQPLASSPLGS